MRSSLNRRRIRARPAFVPSSVKGRGRGPARGPPRPRRRPFRGAVGGVVGAHPPRGGPPGRGSGRPRATRGRASLGRASTRISSAPVGSLVSPAAVRGASSRSCVEVFARRSTMSTPTTREPRASTRFPASSWVRGRGVSSVEDPVDLEGLPEPITIGKPRGSAPSRWAASRRKTRCWGERSRRTTRATRSCTRSCLGADIAGSVRPGGPGVHRERRGPPGRPAPPRALPRIGAMTAPPRRRRLLPRQPRPGPGLARGRRESVHRGAFCLVDTAGTVLESAGAVDHPFFARSSVKCLEVLPCWRPAPPTGSADRRGALPRRLEPQRREPLTSARPGPARPARAGRGGLGGPQPPGDPPRAAPPGSGHEPGRIRNNCSGKHAGFLALTRFLGADPASYLDFDRPADAGPGAVAR